MECIHGRKPHTPYACGMPSHHRRRPLCVNSPLGPWYLMLANHTCRPSLVSLRLFHDALVGVEAVAEVFGVLVRGVVGQHLAAGGALERLEARLALDALRRDVLVLRQLWLPRMVFAGRTVFSWLFAVGPASPLRSRFCCALRLVSICPSSRRAGRRTWLRYPC
jgi:hypothetical protein